MFGLFNKKKVEPITDNIVWYILDCDRVDEQASNSQVIKLSSAVSTIWCPENWPNIEMAEAAYNELDFDLKVFFKKKENK